RGAAEHAEALNHGHALAVLGQVHGRAFAARPRANDDDVVFAFDLRVHAGVLPFAVEHAQGLPRRSNSMSHRGHREHREQQSSEHIYRERVRFTEFLCVSFLTLASSVFSVTSVANSLNCSTSAPLLFLLCDPNWNSEFLIDGECDTVYYGSVTRAQIAVMAGSLRRLNHKQLLWRQK